MGRPLLSDVSKDLRSKSPGSVQDFIYVNQPLGMSLSVAPVFRFGELLSPGLWTPASCAPCLGFSGVC